MTCCFFGDSLMQENGPETYPQTGWPQAMKDFLKEDIRVLDFAKNGRSTKSFLDEHLFEEGIKGVRNGDLCFISFGHNDEKEDPLRHTDPDTTYQENLTEMATQIQRIGATPIFLTSVTRLHYDTEGNLLHTHGEYPKAMKELAKKLSILCIDLEKLTYQSLQKETEETNQKKYMCFPPHTYPNYPEGKEDRTHLSVLGATWVAGLVVEEMKKEGMSTECFR